MSFVSELIYVANNNILYNDISVHENLCKRFLSEYYGSDTPFMEYFEIEAISFLLARLKPLKVLEWGSGQSTLFFSQFIDENSEWHAIEHVEDWALKISLTNTNTNVKIHHVPANNPKFDNNQISGASYDDFKNYLELPSDLGPFDLIIVDGRARVSCLEKASTYLSPNGLIILHDANRKRYWSATRSFTHQMFLLSTTLDGGGLWLGSNSLDVKFYFYLANFSQLLNYYRKIIPPTTVQRIRNFIEWEDFYSNNSITLYAGDLPLDNNHYPCNFIGLSLNRSDHTHVQHDITDPIPLPDNSVDLFQSEDVFEHISYDKLLSVLNDIFRILKPGGLLRLSLPDYGCDVLRERSIKDAAGNIVFNPGGGGTPDNPGHVWFPRLSNVRQLLSKTKFNSHGTIDFLHYWNMDDSTFVTRPIDYSKGYVRRTPDFDARVKTPYRPMSIVVDLVKTDILSGSMDSRFWIRLGNIIAFPYNWQFPAITEKFAYERVCQTLPDTSRLTYIGFPWATLIDLLQTGQKEKADLYLRKLEQIPRINSSFKITVAQHIYVSRYIEVFEYAGITDIFWSHATKDTESIGKVRIHPFPLYPVRCLDTPEPAKKEFSVRKYLYSFIGAYDPIHYLTKARLWISELPPDKDALIIRNTEWHYQSDVYDSQILDKEVSPEKKMKISSKAEAYRHALEDSVFSLCPSGSGPNSIRLWESLGFGCIPVIMADTLKLPGREEEWKKAAIIVPEDKKAVSELPAFLREIAADRKALTSFRDAGQRLWNKYGPDDFIHDLITFADEISRGTAINTTKSASCPNRDNNPSYPKISIVTPSFNQGQFLEECIDSILSQNYPNLEYIIMDGGSTDGSVEIIKKYDKFLTYWQSKPDGGQYEAINEGFRLSSGEIMAWLNSDDKLHPGSLRLLATVFGSRPEVEWLTGRPTGWREDGSLKLVFDHLPTWSRARYFNREFTEYFIQQESTFWRRSLWDRAGGRLDTEWKLAADFELWARFFRHARLYSIDALLGGFRFHDSQKTASMLAEYKREAHAVIDREIALDSCSPARPSLSAAAPITIEELALSTRDCITPGNFDLFTYARGWQFAYFKERDLELYGTRFDPASSDLKIYQDLLVYSFIRENIPPGARILEIGGGDSRVLQAISGSYECWNLDKLEGVGNGLTHVVPQGYRLIKAYLGEFSRELPDDYFDFVFSISTLEHVAESPSNFENICRDLDRLMKEDGLSLHCFDVVLKEGGNWTNGLLHYLFKSYGTLNRFIPLERLSLDPHLHVMSEAAYDSGWRKITRSSYQEFGRPTSYNILWRKTAPASGDAAVPRAIPQLQAVIATSIAPGNRESQKAAVASWLRLGCRVISVNSTGEIDQLADAFPEVRFYETHRTAANLTGKPLVYLDDIFRALEESGAEICGIVNSDILLTEEAALVRFLASETPQSMVFGSRLDVPSLESREGEEFTVGFDYFFFDRSLIARYPRTDFCLGAPWWDYWVPLVPLLLNLPAKRITSPVAFHPKHPTKWDENLWDDFGKFLFDALFQGSFSSTFSDHLLTDLKALGFNGDFHSFAVAVLRHIKNRAETRELTIPCPDVTDRHGGHKYLVSAIVSTYNSESFMRGCLEDLTDQTLFTRDKLEIIVVDSASPQNEGAIVREFRERFGRRIRYIRTEKRETIYQAWNRGIKAARGRYVTNANTDDRHRSDALEVMAAALDANPGAALVYGDVFVTNFPNQTFPDHIRCGYHIRPEYSPEIMLSGCHMGPQPMWRKSLHEDLGYFSEELRSAGDYEFWCRIALRHPLLHIRQFLGLYFENPAGFCNADTGLSVQETLAVRSAYAESFPTPSRNFTDNLQYRGDVTEKQFVNICTVTYNRLDFTRQYIDALVRTTDFPHVITIIDNNSQDGTSEYLKELKRNGIIKNLVLLDENVGVAKAANLGWSLEPDAAYYLKLDNDIVIGKNGWLSRMVETIEGISSLGAVACNFEPASYPLQVIEGLPIRIKPEGNLGGACILIPRRTHDLLGFWSEDYGLYGEEDYDYGIRIRLAGLENGYMEDEEIGIHLPAGRAAVIDMNTYRASDGVEEDIHADYRARKDAARKRTIDSGVLSRNIRGYGDGSIPLKADSPFSRQWMNRLAGASPTAPGPECSKIRVIVFSLEAREYACARLRLVAPLTALSDEIELCWWNDGNNPADYLERSDLIVIQRGFPRQETRQILDALFALGKPVLYDLDDLLIDLPVTNPHRAEYESCLPFIVSCLERSTAVSVSTGELAKALRPYNRNIHLLPNLIDDALFHRRDRKPGGPVVIGYAGTPTHGADLEFISSALERIALKHGDRVAFRFLGCATGRLAALPGFSSLPFDPDYQSYARKLGESGIDIAVAPLADNPFNRCKSNIKWLEFSACGIPGVYADLPPYSGSIRHGETGFLAGPESDAWFDAIDRLVGDAHLRRDVAARAFNEVSKRCTISVQRDCYRETYRQIIEGVTSMVSIIIPIYNKLDYTTRCIESLAINSGEATPYEIILVDNASSDGTPSYLQALQGDVTVISNKTNLGFARACNQGARLAQGRHLLFLNNDTVPHPGWLDALVRGIDEDGADIVGARLLYPNGRIQHAGVAFDEQSIGYHIFNGFPADAPAVNRKRFMQCVTAACMLVKREVFQQLGGFDEGYRNGFEDVDLCLRAGASGKRILYTPESVLIHFEETSEGRKTHEQQNIQRYLARWQGKVRSDDGELYRSEGFAKEILADGRHRIRQLALAPAPGHGTGQKVNGMRQHPAQPDRLPDEQVAGQEPRTAGGTTRPTGRRFSLEKARELKEQGNFTEALTIFSGLLEGGERSVLADMGDCLANLDRMAEAEGRYYEALEINGNDPKALVGLGVLSMLQENQDKAAGWFDLALAADGSNARALCGLGMVRNLQNRHSEAAELFSKALDADPEQLTALNGLVGCAYQSGKFEEAEQRLADYLMYHPADLDMLFSLAGIRYKTGNAAAALESIETVLLFEPGYQGGRELQDKILEQLAA